MRLLYVCLGGAVGSGLRYLAVEWSARLVGTSFPWGVLAVNALGSFAIAFVMVVAAAKGALDGDARIAITAGLLGGFTTYSSFNQDTLKLMERSYLTAALNVASTIVVCLGAGVLGDALGRRVV